MDNLAHIERLRNDIVHHHAELSSAVVEVYVAHGMQFVDRFLRSHLTLTINSFLTAEEHAAMKEAVYNYSERMKVVFKKIDEDYRGNVEDVTLEMCSPCGERTVAVTSSMVGSSSKCYSDLSIRYMRAMIVEHHVHTASARSVLPRWSKRIRMQLWLTPTWITSKANRNSETVWRA